MTETQELQKRASAHMMACYSPFPFIVGRGQGTRLWDLDGREYLDFTTGIAVNALGHAHPEVVGAITKQAALFCHTSNMFQHRPYIELCERLCELSFGSKVFLANSGAEAMEAAMKLARRYFFDKGETRPEFVATTGSFHGRTLGALSITGQDTYRKGFEPFLPSATLLPFGDIEAMKKAVSSKTAAVILEPIQGNSGIVVPPAGYLKAVRDLCSERGALFIADEIQTGVGRTGRWFAYQHEGITPDIMTVAKAIGGGLPLGAMITNEELGKTFSLNVHGSTFGGNPVACAAGLATLRVLGAPGFIERVAQAGSDFIAQLRELGQKRPVIKEVRGRGLMIGVALTEAAKPYQVKMREQGLLTTASGQSVLRLLPPLNVTDEELAKALGIIADAIK
jgi:acetylornithine/N-succinyldiaminopimelate aminotransferase